MIEDYGSGFHPLAVVAVLTMLYGLYWALIQQRKGGENYGKMVEEMKKNNQLLLDEDPFIVFVIGGPSSGKTTLAKELSNKFNMLHLNLNELVGKELSDPSSTNYSVLSNCIKDGVTIPSSTITSIFRNAMLTSNKTRFIIDGFPRKIEQTIEFQDNICSPNLVVNIDCTIEEQIKRFNNPDRKIIESRIDAYNGGSKKVINYYKRVEKLANVSCFHSPESILQHTSKIIEDLVQKNSKSIKNIK
ncbi:P-loop containing nucleoside triphosphate hydrolase protein [Neoconidiobolus thromboides FSU 785]|nr:P-loop containing nucleoside triphosphate hydrolase protein [Neoconidiobolus thromboides FSU 785]